MVIQNEQRLTVVADWATKLLPSLTSAFSRHHNDTVCSFHCFHLQRDDQVLLATLQELQQFTY